MSDQLTQLTKEELAALRQLLLADSRRQWIVSSFAGAARWVGAIIGTWLLVKEILPWLK